MKAFKTGRRFLIALIFAVAVCAIQWAHNVLPDRSLTAERAKYIYSTTVTADEPLRWDSFPEVFVSDRVYYYAYHLDDDDTYDLPFIDDSVYIGEVDEVVEIGTTPKDHLVANDSLVLSSSVYKNYEFDRLYLKKDGAIARYN